MEIGKAAEEIEKESLNASRLLGALFAIPASFKQSRKLVCGHLFPTYEDSCGEVIRSMRDEFELENDRDNATQDDLLAAFLTDSEASDDGGRGTAQGVFHSPPALRKQSSGRALSRSSSTKTRKGSQNQRQLMSKGELENGSAAPSSSLPSKRTSGDSNADAASALSLQASIKPKEVNYFTMKLASKAHTARVKKSKKRGGSEAPLAPPAPLLEAATKLHSTSRKQKTTVSVEQKFAVCGPSLTSSSSSSSSFPLSPSHVPSTPPRSLRSQLDLSKKVILDTPERPPRVRRI